MKNWVCYQVLNGMLKLLKNLFWICSILWIQIKRRLYMLTTHVLLVSELLVWKQEYFHRPEYENLCIADYIETSGAPILSIISPR